MQHGRNKCALMSTTHLSDGSDLIAEWRVQERRRKFGTHGRGSQKGGREKIVHSPFDLRSKKEAATCKNQRTDRMAASPMGRLTEEQRKAVVDSWALVEPDATEHGLKFFQQ